MSNIWEIYCTARSRAHADAAADSFKRDNVNYDVRVTPLRKAFRVEIRKVRFD